ARAGALAQVERVERVAAVGVEVGQLGLEEVVAEAVDVDDGRARGVLEAPADESRPDGALAVRILAQLDRALLVRVAQDVCRPVAHEASLSVGPTVGPW